MDKFEIRFNIAQIVTEQFAIIETSFVGSEQIQFGVGIGFEINEENMLLKCISKFQFEINEISFIILNVNCIFKIDDTTWKNSIDKNNKISFAKDFISHLASITIGAARGILHTKTENTKFCKFLIPIINLNDLIKEDFSSVLEIKH